MIRFLKRREVTCMLGLLLMIIDGTLYGWLDFGKWEIKWEIDILRGLRGEDESKRH